MKNVFLSYADQDAPAAEELARLLKSRGFAVFVDTQELQPGENWARAVGDALSNADAMVVLLSPDAVASRSVQREIDFALSERRFKDHLIPVVLRPTSQIPWVLQKQHMIRASARRRPAAFRKVADHLAAASE